MIRAALFLVFALAVQAQAQVGPVDQARNAASQLRAAGEALEGANESYDRIDALTRVIRAYETGLAAMRDSLRAARLREADVAASFQDEAGRTGAVISALTAMGRAPEATLLLHPSGPEATARAGMLMRDVTPAMLGQVEEMRRRLGEIATLRTLQDTALDDLEAGLAEWRDARTRLAAAIEARGELPVRITENPDAMARLATNAATLSDFADSLAALPPDAISDGLPEFAEAQGNLDLPVPGTVLRGYGEADGQGVARPGWTVATAPGALVTAPWPATIRYSGPLLDYGNVMILEPQAGYLMVFAGLDALYGAPGEVVSAGAPIGTVPGGSEAMAGFDPQDGAAARQEIYVELRRNGDAVDPASWFRPEQG